MKKVLVLFILLSTAYSYAQDEFKLAYNDKTSRVFYQGTIKNDSLTKTELFNKGVAYFNKKNKTLSTSDEAVGLIVGEASFATIGKKSAYGRSYHYIFTCEVRIEFKDGKIRWTFDHFKKKSSPGEPGSTLEYFINNYAPDISSKKSRNREAKMLDQIEIAIASQVEDLIEDLRTVFEFKSDDW